MSIISLFVIYCMTNALVDSQTCLTSPPEMQWDADNSATLSFEKATKIIRDFSTNQTITTLTSRQYNGAFPGPTIRMNAGETYRLTLQNNLGAEVFNTQFADGFKNLNYTNIHPHGVHVSGEAPADDVRITIDPQSSFEYVYDIPCDHSGGVHLYHPHHHGSTAMQVGGGAAGAIIINPNDGYETESFPTWYTDLFDDQIVVVIQRLYLDIVDYLGDLSNNGSGISDLQDYAGLTKFFFTYGSSYVPPRVPDNLFSYSGESRLFAINGYYKPTICLEENKFRKLQIVFVDMDEPSTR
eukprot:786509_1